MTECAHEEFAAKVEVGRITDENGTAREYMAEVSVNCARCGTPFHFRGVAAGLSFSRPMVDVAATTLRAPIAPGVSLLLPLALRFEVSSS